MSIQQLTITVFSIITASLLACAPTVRPTVATPPGRALMAEFWTEPRNLTSRDLFYGAGGKALAPPPADGPYELIKRDTGGFSIGFDVKDKSGQEWSVKIGPEAQSEVVASRLVWAVGYHQPPAYYVPKWRLTGGDEPFAPVHGRFRPKEEWLKTAGEWSWQQNPFVGTRPYRGLLVLMMMLNSTDLKNSNNALYELTRTVQGARRWYVVKDLGATLGETGALYPRRNWVEGFEKHGFIDRVEDGRVHFDFGGLHKELLEDITPADVRWMADRLGRLTPKQWNDAFRAGGYDPAQASRFIRKLQQKIQQGRALPAGGS